MDRIIQEVLDKIAARQGQQTIVTYTEQGPLPNDKLFIDFDHVALQGVTINLLVALYRMTMQDQWVAWILKGISFDVHFSFQINENAVNFIPLKMMRDWPVTFTVGTQAPVVSFYGTTIGRSDLAAIADHAVIVVTQKQRLTSEATALIEQKHILKKVRTDEDCIWQK